MSEAQALVDDVLEEAREDLSDALRLAGGGQEAKAAAAFHAEQAAEKALRALCETRGIPTNWQWDVARLWEALGEDDEGIAGRIASLGEFSTPAKTGVDEASLKEVLEAAKAIMEFAYRSLGMQMEPLEIPEIQPSKPQRRPPKVNVRRPRSRRNSYVKRFYICPTCGVKVPFSRQTANGRVRCPHCGGLMKLVE